MNKKLGLLSALLGVQLVLVAVALLMPLNDDDSQAQLLAFAADEVPLLGLVSLIGPALAMGNRITLVASEPYPLAATDFYQVLDTSDVPAGVVNILTGSHS